MAPGFAQRGARFPDKGAIKQRRWYFSKHRNTIFREKIPDRHKIFPDGGADNPRRGGYGPPWRHPWAWASKAYNLLFFVFFHYHLIFLMCSNPQANAALQRAVTKTFQFKIQCIYEMVKTLITMLKLQKNNMGKE